MDEGSSLSSALIVLALVAFQALITLSYTALTTTRRTELREQVGSGDNLQIATRFTQLIVHFAIAAVTLIAVLQQAGEVATVNRIAWLTALVYVPISLITLILSDLVPSALNHSLADILAPILSPFMRVLNLLLRPVVWLSRQISKLIASTFGGGEMVNIVTEEEIISMLDAGREEGTIEDDERAMIYSILQFDDTLAREVMVPRIDIEAVEITTPFDEALSRFIDTGHSRIPVFDENVDNVKGVLYAKDMLTLYYNNGPRPGSIAQLMRPAHFVPENMTANQLLKDLQNRKVHIAMVVDEYGGTAGLVTIENLMEEIVGDIQDEYDPEEEAEYLEHAPGEYIVDAGIDLDDFNNLLDVELPTDDNDTLGGYIYSEIGRVPEVNEVVETGQLTLTVQSVDGRRILKVHVQRHPDENGESHEDSPPDDHIAPPSADTGSAPGTTDQPSSDTDIERIVPLSFSNLLTRWSS